MADNDEPRQKRLQELEAAYKRFEEQITDLHRTLCLYGIACQEILDHPFDRRDDIVAKLPDLSDRIIHALTRENGFALDYAVESLGALSQKVYDALYQDFEPALRKATGIAC